MMTKSFRSRFFSHWKRTLWKCAQLSLLLVAIPFVAIGAFGVAFLPAIIIHVAQFGIVPLSGDAIFQFGGLGLITSWVWMILLASAGWAAIDAVDEAGELE